MSHNILDLLETYCSNIWLSMCQWCTILFFQVHKELNCDERIYRTYMVVLKKKRKPSLNESLYIRNTYPIMDAVFGCGMCWKNIFGVCCLLVVVLLWWTQLPSNGNI